MICNTVKKSSTVKLNILITDNYLAVESNIDISAIGPKNLGVALTIFPPEFAFNNCTKGIALSDV